MNSIKKINLIIGVLFLAGVCAQCAGGKDAVIEMENEPPFTIGTSYFQKWVAGVAGGGSGVNVYITIEGIMEGVSIEDIYFRNKKEAAKAKPQNPDLFIGYFKDNARPDVIMDGDAIKEAQNKVPETFPFKLEENEAVVSFLHKGELKFVKVSDMKEKPMLAYPGTNKQDID